MIRFFRRISTAAAALLLSPPDSGPSAAAAMSRRMRLSTAWVVPRLPAAISTNSRSGAGWKAREASDVRRPAHV